MAKKYTENKSSDKPFMNRGCVGGRLSETHDHLLPSDSRTMIMQEYLKFLRNMIKFQKFGKKYL